MRALGIDVPPALLDKWVGWLAPDTQPFFLTPQQAQAWGFENDGREPRGEERDTFRTYAVDSTASVIAWLTEQQFAVLDKPIRAQLVRAQVRHGRSSVPTVRKWQGLLGPELKAQADGHRFVWWKSLLAEHAEKILQTFISEDLLSPSRHAEVTNWPAALPRARELAGTFADGSGPNCFGTVMAAAGVEGADTVWMMCEPFEEWLAEHTAPGGRDDVPGTVFVWRNEARVQHAAITIGDGWMLHKPAQTWWSPRKVRSVAEVRRATRTAGWRLSRHRLIG
ncbi:hypothetical protein GCM10029976_014080 [Kribbella albertanoniae]|uniref:Uncharacterized protein n=1 Tax=Kribbella albertanoniae TaxID=1266829 RepID=A0A4R4QCD7_9ACTN|nr:hypothetical protein [Kribbella albertanoniae]TDC33077.1 hypothetical protein E1261_07120 [Kribbella albertanoniae]